MSLAVIVQGFRNKEIGEFARSVVWDIFAPKCSPPRLFGYNLSYNGVDGGFLYLEEEEFISGCGVQAPSDDAIRDLYAVARQVPSAIHLDDAFFVADPAFLSDIPDYLVAALPKPIRVARSGDELIQLFYYR